MVTKDKEATTIPLPNELPPPLMPEILSQKNSSQAVEMAVTQNVDLMHRLSLALKRTANLESRLEFAERDNHHRKEKLSVLDDELQLLRSNQGQAQLQLRDISDRLVESKNKYATLYQQYVQKSIQVQRVKKRLQLFERFKKRVTTYIRAYIQNLKQNNKNAQVQIQALQNQTFEQQTQLESYQKQIGQLKNQFLQEQTQYYTDLASLVDYHEKRYLGLQRLSKTMDKQNKYLNQKIEDIESQKAQTRQQLSKAKNQIMILEQKLQSSQEASHKRFSKTIDDLNKCKKHLQEKDLRIVHLEAKEPLMKSLQTELEDVQGERDRLSIRLQSKEIEYQEAKGALVEAEKGKQKMTAQNKILSDQVKGFKHIVEDHINDKVNTATKGQVRPSSAEKQIQLIEQLLKS